MYQPFNFDKILFGVISVLSAVVIVNETIEKKTSDQLIKRLENAELTSVDGGRCDRYLTKLISAKQEKAQVDCIFFALKTFVLLVM